MNHDHYFVPYMDERQLLVEVCNLLGARARQIAYFRNYRRRALTSRAFKDCFFSNVLFYCVPGGVGVHSKYSIVNNLLH